MHKDITVATFTISDNNRISNVKVMDQDRFPNIGDTEINALRRWLIGRKTALNRIDVAPVASFYGTSNYMSDNLRSLNDNYWIKDVDSDKTWEDISPEKIDLTEDGVYLSIVKPKDFEGFTPNSPNLTLPGKVPIFWHKMGDRLGLINANAQSDMGLYKKAVSNNFSIFGERTYILLAGNIYTFVDKTLPENVERIPFDQLFFSIEDKTRSKSENFKACCEHYNIKNWREFIRELLAFNNTSSDTKIDLLDIKVLRNTDTLEILGFDKI